MGLPDRIPVFLLSGFLGSGKSTLLNAFLSDPGVQDTAVIINEFGDVAVDHLIVRRGEMTISQVSTGCLCCSDTTDIRSTLDTLESAVRHALVPPFTRVIVEMSGLGDPAPLVNALSRDKTGTGQDTGDARGAEYYLAGVVTLFDAIAGASSVENHFEALKQIAFADRIVLTKTDVLPEPDGSREMGLLSQELRTLNASAEIVDSRQIDVSSLFSPRPYAAVDQGEDVIGWLALEAAIVHETGHEIRLDEDKGLSRHSAGIRTFSIVSETPLSEERFHRFLALLQNSAGQQLLRVKGIIASEDRPEEPLIVHAVQHTVSEPVRLPAWPDADHRTRLVFITDGIDPGPVRELFTAVTNAGSFSFAACLKNAVQAFIRPVLRTVSNLTPFSRRSQ
ncbi:MAG: GTP-binding protein [Pseudomonadota bacterium]